MNNNTVCPNALIHRNYYSQNTSCDCVSGECVNTNTNTNTNESDN